MKAPGLSKINTTQGHIVTGILAFVIGLALWLIYKWIPDLLPFAIAWIVVRPLFKIFQYLDREMHL